MDSQNSILLLEADLSRVSRRWISGDVNPQGPVPPGMTGVSFVGNKGNLPSTPPRHKVSTNNLAGSCSRFKISK